MDSLLPSEIARLVLGYLEEQKCEEAARSFLEMSPHLDECRTVTTTGRRFSTKVNGYTLADILEKFCAANATIQERLSKLSDCQHLKHCGDLSEQLRFLIDGSRGQRFVVNINVPTPPQTVGTSPIISSSMQRKRQHSGSDRDRSKRSNKFNSQSLGKSSEPSVSLGCDTLETTPLQHLPGHSGSGRAENSHQEKKLSVERTDGSLSATEAAGASQSSLAKDARDRSSQDKCSMSTDTKELLLFTNTEVQTSAPYDVGESETELTNEPIENLSLLTKELLNRTELHERIADNINKAILPSDISMRDASLSETLGGGEPNTSIMAEINNAIKSVVTATESDPVFAQFLDDIIGPNREQDTSPDEDGAADHQPLDAVFSEISPDSVAKASAAELSSSVEKKLAPQSPEVPLKNRLRSSAVPQIVRPEEDRAKSQKLVTENTKALEDFNAAAILSIINANPSLEEEKRDVVDGAAPEVLDFAEVIEPSNPATVNPENPEVKTTDVEPLNVALGEVKLSRKAKVRKPRAKPKPKVSPQISENLISEEDIMAMPTLIVCSKEEMACLVPPISLTSNAQIATGGYCASQFLPIAPKIGEMQNIQPAEPLYLRTVTVPTKIPKPNEQAAAMVEVVPCTKSTEIRCPPIRSAPQLSNNVLLNPLVDLSAIGANNTCNPEKITLYSEEASKITVLEEPAVLSTLNIDPVSVSGTGLSPFLKFNNGRRAEDNIESKAAKSTETKSPAIIESKSIVDPERSTIASASKPESYDMLTKRTPRSLLKSRSKNHRLSLSTPRRRSSHIRALDFNTPTKGMNSSRRMSINESKITFSPKTCRTSLFKSPPLAVPSASPIANRLKTASSPVKDCSRHCKIPIATRSPAPKLMGGWEKYTGVGIILGSTSPSSSSSSPVKITAPKVVKSWDADLRESLQIPEAQVSKPPKKKAKPLRKPQTKRPCRGKKGGKVAENEEDAAKSNAAENDEKSAEKTEEPINPEVESTPGPAESAKQSKDTTEVVEKSKIAETVVATATNNNVVVNINKSVKKKYAQLKTITSTVTRIERPEKDVVLDTEFGDKCLNSADSSQRTLPNMLDLETPRKMENFGIPPTPRLLSPSSSSLIPSFGLQATGDDSVKVQGFIATPEFPPTPCIAVTPKQLTENTVDAQEKKDDYGCSNYYQPSSELKDPRLPKPQNDQSRHDMSLPLPGMMLASGTSSGNPVDDVTAPQENPQKGTKLEITQFEVIKENLPRDEAIRELKISTSEAVTKETTKSPVISQNSVDATKMGDKSGSTLNDSSDSDSSCSSSSSSDDDDDSSSSSSSSSSSASCATPKDTKRTPNKIYTDTSNESLQKTASSALLLLHRENESSPKKVFAIVKTDEALAECTTETPVKDETLLAEANISETPSSSKAGCDNVTNLTSKISAFINCADSKKTAEPTLPPPPPPARKALPKVVSVQKVMPNVTIRKPSPGNDLCNVMQNRLNPKELINSISDAKLSRQLEEKRLRTLAKFKEKDKPPAYRSRIKRTVAINNAKKRPAKDETNVDETITGGEKMMPRRQSSRLKVAEQTPGEKPKNNEIDSQEPDIIKTDKHKKAQIFKELFDESCSISTPTKIASEINTADGPADTAPKIADVPKPKTQVSTKKADKSTEKILDLKKQMKIEENEKPKNSNKREDVLGKETIQSDSNKLTKSKVDLVKRDLFSDEESSDHRTTRSRTRQSSDLPKNESLEISEDAAKDRQDDLPGVLECLDLVPTVKNDLSTASQDLSVAEISQSHSEFHFIYDGADENHDQDDAVRSKRKKRKFSNSELEFSVVVELSEEDYRSCSKVMTATPYEEIFSLSPTIARKKGTSESAKSVKYYKTEAINQKNAKMIFNDIQDKPLATSSPVVRIPKTAKSNVKKNDPTKTETKNKTAAIKTEKPSENEKHNPKSRKRKASVSKESQQVEKKSRTVSSSSSPASDPHLLLSNLDLDKFLTTVHGPA